MLVSEKKITRLRTPECIFHPKNNSLTIVPVSIQREVDIQVEAVNVPEVAWKRQEGDLSLCTLSQGNVNASQKI